MRAAIAHLEGLGARSSPVALPDHAALIAGMSGLGAEALVYHRRVAARPPRTTTARRLRPACWPASSSWRADYATALRARRLLRERYDAALANVDLLAAPTVPVPAPLVADAEADVDLSVLPAQHLAGQPDRDAGHQRALRLRHRDAGGADAHRPPLRGGDAAPRGRRVRGHDRLAPRRAGARRAVGRERAAGARPGPAGPSRSSLPERTRRPDRLP